MQTKLINCKMKEIYFTPRNLNEDAQTVESRSEFWNSMNIYAIQNMSVIQLKRA